MALPNNTHDFPSIRIVDERSKTDLQKAEDVAYTLNHTITCLSLDIFSPVVSAYAVRWLHNSSVKHEWLRNVLQKTGIQGSSEAVHFSDHLHLKDWFTGEIVGDLGAVPVTIAMQRMAPETMNSLNRGMEKVLGPLYRWGVNRSTAEWGRDNNVAPDSPEYKAHAEKLYHNEVSHLSQAVTWTGAAFALNVATQKAIGSSYSTGEIITGKLVGALMATTAVLGTRAIAPEKAHDWDEFTSRNIFVPATKAASRLFGLNTEGVDNMVEKELMEFEPAKTASHVQIDGVLASPEKARD